MANVSGERRYDIAVVGGGLAGTTIAAELVAHAGVSFPAEQWRKSSTDR